MTTRSLSSLLIIAVLLLAAACSKTDASGSPSPSPRASSGHLTEAEARKLIEANPRFFMTRQNAGGPRLCDVVPGKIEFESQGDTEASAKVYTHNVNVSDAGRASGECTDNPYDTWTVNFSKTDSGWRILPN
jgi:hypothetical protein